MTFRNCNPRHNEIIGLLFKEYEEFHLPEDATVKAAYDELDKAMESMSLEQKIQFFTPSVFFVPTMNGSHFVMASGSACGLLWIWD